MIGCGSLAEDALQSPGMKEGSSVLKTVMGKGSRSIRTLAPDTNSEYSTYVGINQQFFSPRDILGKQKTIMKTNYLFVIYKLDS